MSKLSCRPGREAIKEQRKEHKKAQRELRRTQKAAGRNAPARPSISNRKCPYKNEAEEKSARLEAVSQQIKAYRTVMPVLLKRLCKIPDPRNPRRIKHKLTVLMIYGILCFAFQMSSRREANREMTRSMFMTNLRRLFPDLEDLPHHDTLARMLGRIDVTKIEEAHVDMIRHLIRNKKFQRYLIGGCYPIAMDGTQKFTRAELWDEECLERKLRSKTDEKQVPDPEPKKQYYVYVLEATLAFHNGMVIPLLSEVLSYTRGDNKEKKQDCEQKAFRRLAQRLKEYFSHLPIMVLLDGLYPNGPVLELCRKNNWEFMIVLQDDSLSTVWEEIHGLKNLQSRNRLDRNWGDRRQHFWWVNDIDYQYLCPQKKKKKKQTVHAVICEESWEQIEPGSTEVVTKGSRHVWLSSQTLNPHNVHELCNLGARHRWGIESGFLVEKHHGYQYEHCFSYEWQTMRGYHYLMRLGHALNVLARHSWALKKYVRDLGVRGLIAFVRNTIAAPWLNAGELQRIATAPCQLRLE
ncbi:MAG TPA: transposase family protein [Verrucomicrobia bacterium]|nr:transposase family protein [Verrucomicrobiota bacterium]